jgi:hypothetical protein
MSDEPACNFGLDQVIAPICELGFIGQWAALQRRR